MHIPEGAEDWALVRWDEGQALGVGDYGDNGVGWLLARLGLDLGRSRGDGGGEEAGQRQCSCIAYKFHKPNVTGSERLALLTRAR